MDDDKHRPPGLLSTALFASEVRELDSALQLLPQDSRHAGANQWAAAARSGITGWPTCAVCGGPVERVETDKDITTGAVILVARCHGEVDEIELGQVDLLRARAVSIDGVAFATTRLSQATPKLGEGKS